MIKKIASFIGKWLFEIIPVFIGVILALYFSNLKEDNDKVRFVEQLKTSIIAEIDGNIADIDTLLVSKQNAMDTLLAYADIDSLSIYNVLSKTGVISFPSLEFSTWSIIQSSGNAFVLETNTLREMVSMDIMINRHHIESVNNVGDYILLNMFKKDKDVKMTMYMLMGNNADLEKQIRDDLKLLREMIMK